MAIYHGTQKIVGLYHGTDKIIKRYKDTQLIFQSRVLPAGFIECEYLESTGTQWIDTGIANFSTIHIVSNAMASSDNCESLFGARVGVGNQDLRILFSAQRRITVGLWNRYWGYEEQIPTSDYLGKRKFEINDCAFYCDGVLVHNNTSKPASKATSTFNIYLFAFNNDGVVASQGSWKMYDFKLYDGTTLVRDFIPCLDTTGTPCLYDTVSKTCFYNQGTGTFKYKVKVPSWYQEVEYIESTGTQRINTRFKANQDTRIVVDFQSNISYNGTIFWGSDGSTSGRFNLYFYSNETQYRVGYNTQLITNSGFPITSNRSLCDWNKNVVNLNGNTYTLTQETFTISENSITLFNTTYWALQGNNSSIKLYSCQIFDNSKLVRHFVPCYRKSDNVIGLYDAITGQLFTNQGSGTFIKGGDI